MSSGHFYNPLEAELDCTLVDVTHRSMYLVFSQSRPDRRVLRHILELPEPQSDEVLEKIAQQVVIRGSWALRSVPQHTRMRPFLA